MAFTEQGVAMLSSVVNSKQAIGVNIAIMLTFVKLRQMLDSHSKFAPNSKPFYTGIPPPAVVIYAAKMTVYRIVNVDMR